MYKSKPFKGGVHSVLLARWMLECKTPLVIRNNLSLGYTEPKPAFPKSRGLDLSFKWQRPDPDRDLEVAALHYGYEVDGSTMSAFHRVPASSVRGVLRSWTINHLALREYRNRFVPLEMRGEKETQEEYDRRTEEHLAAVRRGLEMPGSGYGLIASLFGLALETREGNVGLSNAGRLDLQTGKFSQATPFPVSVNGTVVQGDVGPKNAKRQMTVRNPLDRITHASKEGGLHHFMEFCQGETFTVDLSILNPECSDLGLLSLWVREMNDGLLRIGALSSIGRGRVQVADQSYTLWARRGAAALAGFTPASDEPGDALAGLWQRYTLPVEQLSQFEKHLEPWVGGAHA